MLKRSFDLIFASLGLVIFSPVLFFVALMIRLKLGSPVIFSQVRPGLHCRPFKLYKFRTMRNSFDKTGNLLPDKERLTAFGTFLRSTSIDELPELWNVILGEMSLVGPRPLLTRYIPYYSQEEIRRHNVLPGITGWAQVNGRNLLSWDDRLQLDVWYVKNKSFFLDLMILFMTIKGVLLREGVVPEGGALLKALDDERRASSSDFKKNNDID